MKIREAQLEKIPYMLVVGDKEMENSRFGAPAHRRRPGRQDSARGTDEMRLLSPRNHKL